MAQRSGELLVVNFTDMANLPRSAAEAALREAKAAEQAARAEVETQRQRLTEVLRHLPAQVAAYHGPDHVYTFVNPRYQAYFPDQELLGHPVREATPAAAGQGFFDRLDRVYQTGEPYCGVELPVNLDFSTSGRGQQVFINTYYHPLYDSQGEIEGVLDFSYDVTEQVRARQQVQQFNQDLEARVADTTQTALALQADMLAAAQRQVQERETLLPNLCPDAGCHQPPTRAGALLRICQPGLSGLLSRSPTARSADGRGLARNGGQRGGRAIGPRLPNGRNVPAGRATAAPYPARQRA